MNGTAAPERPWRAAALWCAACGALFAVVYNACNWYTAQRSDVGTLCVYAFAPPGETAAPARNPFVARLYAAGAAVCAALVALLGRAGIALLWPAVALALLAAANAGWGAAVFRKRDGRLPLTSRVVLGPVLVGQWVSWRLYARGRAPWNEAAPGVWIGRRLSDREAADAVARGVTAVLDLTAESSAPSAFRGVAYRNVPVLDLTAPSPGQLRACTAFIAEESRRGIVYVHCKAGWSRSAGAVGAYLLASGVAQTADQAISILRRVRPGIVIRPEIVAGLRAMEAGDAVCSPT